MNALPFLILAFPGLLAGASALAQACPSIQYRLWRNGEPTWFDAGTPVPIPVGEEVQIYVQVRSRSATPYLAEAELGWPWDMGYAMPTPVELPIALIEQAPDDREVGRITVHGRKIGSTRLAYRLTAVEPPGHLEDVPEDCRHGLVPVVVEEADAGVLEPEPGPAKTLLADTLDGTGVLARPGQPDRELTGGSIELLRDRTATIRLWDRTRRAAAELTGSWKRSDAGFRLEIGSGPGGAAATGDGLVTVTDGIVERLDVTGTYSDGGGFVVRLVRGGFPVPRPRT